MAIGADTELFAVVFLHNGFLSVIAWSPVIQDINTVLRVEKV